LYVFGVAYKFEFEHFVDMLFTVSNKLLFLADSIIFPGDVSNNYIGTLCGEALTHYHIIMITIMMIT